MSLVCCGNKEIEMVLAAGGVAAIVGGMQVHAGVAGVQQEGSFVLRCIALDSDEGQESVLAAGGSDFVFMCSFL